MSRDGKTSSGDDCVLRIGAGRAGKNPEKSRETYNKPVLMNQDGQ